MLPSLASLRLSSLRAVGGAYSTNLSDISDWESNPVGIKAIEDEKERRVLATGPPEIPASIVYYTLHDLWTRKWQTDQHMVVHVNPTALKMLTDQIRENFVKIKDDSWRAFLQNAIQITSDIWPEFKAAIAGLAVVSREGGKNVRRRIAAHAGPVVDIGAPRGGRMPFEADKFYADRASRLTASLLPYWMGLPGQFNSIGRDKIVRILNANDGRWRLPVDSDYASKMLRWGIQNEARGIYVYMEITRKLVGLGSTRNREPLASEQRIEDDPEGTKWEWADLLAATPDGFIYDLDHGNAGVADIGLLEVICPAYSALTSRGIMRRHDVEYHIKPETNHYYMLQMWAQLETCHNAEYVDLVHWKRSTPFGQSASEFIWIQRLYRNPVKHARIKNMLQSSFGEFARALRAMDDDSTDATRNTDEDEAYERDRVPERTMRKNRGDNEMPVPGYKATAISQRDRQALRDELDEWVRESMCWRNTLESPNFPWRSKATLEAQGQPMTGLACRYTLSTLEVATHFGVPGESGYTRLPVNGKRLFANEVL